MTTKVESAQREAIKNELANNQDAAPVGRVLSSPEVTVDDMKGLTPDEKIKFRAAIIAQKQIIGDITYNALETLLKEAENTPSTVVVDPNNGSKKSDKGESEKPKGVPQDVIDAVGHARTGVKAAFGSPGDAKYKEYISLLQQVVAKVPGYEPSSQKDIGDAIHQSRDFNLAFISWLEGEAAKDTNSFDTSAKGSGMYPFVGEKTTFASVEEKRKVIAAMLTGLGDALQKPDVQAGMIETFLGEGLIKKGIVILGGTAILGVLAIVLAWNGFTWVSKKTLGPVGSVIAGAIATGAKKGWGGATSTVSTAAHSDGLKGRAARAATGAATGLAIDLATGMPGVATTIGTVSGALRGTPILGGTPHGTPAGAPATGPANNAVYRELDMTKNIEKTVHNGIIEEIYKAQNGGAAPTPNEAKNLSESIKSGIATPPEVAEYQSRVTKYLSLTQPSLGDAKKVAEYNANMERAIKGEKDPSKWNLKAKSAVKGAVATNEAALRARLATVVNDGLGEKLIVGGVETKVKVGAKIPIEELQNISDEIEEKKAKLEELKKAEKKLKQILNLEGEYGKLQVRVIALPALITTAEATLSTAEATRDVHNSSFLVPADSKNPGGRKVIDTASRDGDPTYQRDKKLADKAKSDLEKLFLERDTTIPNKLSEIQTNLRGITGESASSITRYGQAGLVFDAHGDLIDSKNLQKIGTSPVAATPGTGIKGSIATVTLEISTLEGQLDPRLAALHAIDPTVPDKWNKAGISIGIERVPKTSLLVEALIKKLKK